MPKLQMHNQHGIAWRFLLQSATSTVASVATIVATISTKASNESITSACTLEATAITHTRLQE